MSLADDLERLAALHRAGTLSDAEFASAKARALGDAPAAPPGAPLRGLHALQRSRRDAWIGGVCGGLGAVTDLPAWLWRLAFVALAVCGGSGAIVYLLLWILLPKEPEPTVVYAGPQAAARST